MKEGFAVYLSHFSFLITHRSFSVIYSIEEKWIYSVL